MPVEIASSEAAVLVLAKLERLRSEVRQAVRIRSALEVGNDKIGGRFKGRSPPGVRTFNLIQHELAHSLALNVSRWFDHSIRKPLARQDKASIPVIVALLDRPDVVQILEDDVHSRLTLRREHATENVVRFHASVAELQVLDHKCRLEPSVEAAALTCVKQLRDTHLAHALTNEIERGPTYSELYRLIDLVSPIITRATLAIAGTATFPEEDEEAHIKDAHEFYLALETAAEAA